MIRSSRSPRSSTGSPKMRSSMPTATRSARGTSATDSPMIIGANQAALILEVGSIQGTTAVVIVHAMRAREKFLR